MNCYSETRKTYDTPALAGTFRLLLRLAALSAGIYLAAFFRPSKPRNRFSADYRLAVYVFNGRKIIPGKTNFRFSILDFLSDQEPARELHLSAGCQSGQFKKRTSLPFQIQICRFS